MDNKINIKEMTELREAVKQMEYERNMKKIQDAILSSGMDYKVIKTMTSTAEASARRKSSKDELNRRLTQSIDRYTKEISKATEALEKVKEMKFDVGNVAFHTKLGNVVITDIYLESEQESVYMEIRADFTDGYVYQVVGAEGRGFVREHELTEITEITKNLYGK